MHVPFAPTRPTSGPRRTFRPVSLCLPCVSTGREGVQSAAQLRHVQGRDNVIHVFGALRQLCSVVGRSPRACAICAQARPASGPLRTFRPHRYAFLVTRQGAKAFNQPLSFDTSKVATMSDMFRVRSARAWNRCLYGPSPCICRPRPPPHPHTHTPSRLRPASRPAPLAPHRIYVPSFRVGRRRRRSISR